MIERRFALFYRYTVVRSWCLQFLNFSPLANQLIPHTHADTVTGAVFQWLHRNDDTGIEDSSKNLRVLWVRALLAHRGEIEDDVADKLLPKDSRGLVTTDDGARLFNPIIQFTEWIQSRTEFIDGGLDAFLDSPACRSEQKFEDCNVVLFGAGYDTRSMRYRNKHGNAAHFFEVDLPSVVKGKQILYEKFIRENDPTFDLTNDGPTLIPFDLNSCNLGPDNVKLIDMLSENGMNPNIPTM